MTTGPVQLPSNGYPVPTTRAELLDWLETYEQKFGEKQAAHALKETAAKDAERARDAAWRAMETARTDLNVIRAALRAKLAEIEYGSKV